MKFGFALGCGVGASATTGGVVLGVGCGAFGSGRVGEGTGGAAFVIEGAGAGATFGVSAGGDGRGGGSIERRCSSVRLSTLGCGLGADGGGACSSGKFNCVSSR